MVLELRREVTERVNGDVERRHGGRKGRKLLEFELAEHDIVRIIGAVTEGQLHAAIPGVVAWQPRRDQARHVRASVLNESEEAREGAG